MKKTLKNIALFTLATLAVWMPIWAMLIKGGH